MTFYSADHIGNRFGIKGPDYGPHGHLGVDFNKMPSGTSIPAWAAGHVVERGYSTNLGNYLIVKTSLGYVGYHHMLSQAFKVPGDNVNAGDIVGRLGMTGLLATGVHLHTTLADSAMVGGFDVHDPLPHINLGTSTASTNSHPIDGDTPAPAPIPTLKERTMFIYNTGGGPNSLYLSGNGKSMPFTDETINGQQITAQLSHDTCRRVIYDNPEGELSINGQEAAIFQFWVARLR